MIILCCGQPKSASTFLAELARRACVVAGSRPGALAEEYLAGHAAAKGAFWAGDLGPLAKIAEGLPAEARLAVKTHAPPAPDVAGAIGAGRMRALISYRHPGDAALSSYEAGARSRAEGLGKQPAFAALTSHREAIDFMARVIEDAVVPWLRSGMGAAVSFDELASAAPRVTEAVANAARVDAEALLADKPFENLLAGKKRVYNYNQVVTGRYREALSAEDIAYLNARLGRFIGFCEGEPAASAL